MSLRRRLRSGDSIDTKAMAVASKHVPAADQSDNPLVMRQVFEAILPLNDLARSDYVEIARDAAAAYCSLSLADDSKPAFLATDALSSVLHLAKRSDPQIRENISEAIGRLCQHPLVKRPFVAAGLLDVLVGFSTTGSKAMAANSMYAICGLTTHDEKRSDAQRFARLKPDQADKENITKAADGFFVDFAFDMTRASSGEKGRPDPKTRLMAITTLTALLDGEESCLIVLRRGGRDRFLNLLRSRDGALKNGAAASLQVLMRVADPEHGAQMREEEFLAEVFAALSEAVDVPLLLALLNVTQDVIQCAPTAMAGPTTELRLRMMHLGLSGILQRHAHRLVVLLSAHECDTQDRPTVPGSPPRDGKSSRRQTPAPLMLLRRVMKLLLELLKGRRVVRLFANSENLRFVFFLCRHADKRVSRGASRLLGRLSDLPEAKSLILSDRANLPQLLALSSALSHVSQTVARVLAELAEAWQNRCPLVQGGIVTSLTALMMSSWTGSTRYNCARCVADLAEAVDLRELIASRAATALNQLLKNPQDNESVVEQALRAIVNLVCPAGEVATVPGSNVPQEAPGRYGLSVGVEYGVASDDDDDDDGEEDEDEEEEEEEEE